MMPAKPKSFWNLDTKIIGKPVLFFDEIDSTSNLAASYSFEKTNNGLAIIADCQTSGKGQYGRVWTADRGQSVLLSVLIFPPENLKRPALLTAWAAVAVCNTILDFIGLKAEIKWPNDILVNEKKISGLIAEIVGDGVVIGIGINVGMSSEELPVLTATSLAIEGVSDTNRNQILAKVLSQFESNFSTWDEGDNSIAQIYTSLSSTLGTKVQIHYPNEKIEKGIAVAISPRGELILDTGSHVQAGDVVHLR